MLSVNQNHVMRDFEFYREFFQELINSVDPALSLEGCGNLAKHLDDYKDAALAAADDPANIKDRDKRDEAIREATKEVYKVIKKANNA